MKKFIVLSAAIAVFLAVMPVMAAESMVFDSTDNYLGGCQLTSRSDWEITRDLEVAKFQIWYSWNQGETSLPVTVLKDGQAFAEFTAQRGDCDPYQQQWCNADYAINKTFPQGRYSTAIPEARQCLKPGKTGTVRLYGTESAAGKTETTAPEPSCPMAAACENSCASAVAATLVITALVSFAAAYFIFRKRS